MNKSTIALLILLLGSFLLQAQESETPKIESNVIYGMHGGLALLMNVHHPVQPNGIGILVIPGCGWHRPLSYDAEPLGNPWYLSNVLGVEFLLEKGYTVFAIQHRAAPVFQYPAAVEDAQRAVQFIRHHASRFGIDSTYLGAVGHSSGGHLVSMLGTLDDIQDQNSLNPISQQSSRVQAVVALSPPTDLFKFVREGKGDVGAASSFLGMHFMGYYDPKNPRFEHEYEQFKTASPITHATKGDAPFLLVHGDQDATVPLSQATVFEAKLREASVPTELITIENGNHMLGVGDAYEIQGDLYFEQMLKLFDTHLTDKK